MDAYNEYYNEEYRLYGKPLMQECRICKKEKDADLEFNEYEDVCDECAGQMFTYDEMLEFITHDTSEAVYFAKCFFEDFIDDILLKELDKAIEEQKQGINNGLVEYLTEFCHDNDYDLRKYMEDR